MEISELRFIWFGFLLVCLASLSVGCDSTTSVSGTVTVNGEPVKKGSISFRPEDGKGPSFGGMIIDGSYDIADAKTGTKIAVVSAIDEGKVVKSRAEAEAMIEKARAEGKQPFEAMKVDIITPMSEGNSRTVEITEGAQVLDFAISSK